ncbi:HlyD family secretion protein [Synechococcus sp. UW69]|uniref:HlyD family secretion protein n=1 Tax=Synechococcus sp. UW69 TaxID=368493 RepID=UPI0014839CD6|nr:HlyD family efflux transporter periplasmic adaptor subunit [Synechococcus sp. UW69]
MILLAFGGSALVASFIIKIDEVITVAGSLRPLEGTTDVLAPVTATVEELKVKEGDSVEKGDIILLYDVEDAKIKKRDLIENITSTQMYLQKNLELRKIKLDALKRSYLFSSEIAQRYEYLSEQGAASELSQLSQEQKLEDIKSQILQIEQETEQLKLQFNQKIRSMRSDLERSQLLIDNSIIKSTLSGVVFDLNTSAKQVTPLGKPLMQLIPNDVAKAEVFVSNRDIGFVALGQPSEVKVDAYPFTKFGGLDGNVTHIGADALEPDNTNPSYRFPVTITLDSSVLISQGRELPLKPGMSVQANLMLRQKKLISLITDMFTKNVEGLKSLRD